MVALQVADIREFMQKLLIQTAFDQFYLLEGDICTFASFKMDGMLNQAYYSSDEIEALDGQVFCRWAEVKPFALQLMKGKKLPVRFKFVLQLSDKNTKWLLDKHQLTHLQDQLQGLYLNIVYQEQKLVCVTGLSYKTFVMDKTLDHLWDVTARQYMKQQGIPVIENE